MFRIYFFFFIASVSSKMDPFIVGGTGASIKQWPFITFIEAIPKSLDDSPTVCGGSLISSQTVLTAGHCTDDVTNKKRKMNEYIFMIFMGHSSLKKATMSRKVLDYMGHESYRPSDPRVRNDIALMFLEKHVTFSNTVKKAILVRSESDLSVHEQVAVAGWGRINPHNEDCSERLKMVNLRSISYKECNNSCPTSPLKGRVVCTGKSKEYPYSGDSGGPLVKKANYYQVGIVSYRDETTGVTVFTSVPGYYDWIQKTQKNMFNRFCKGKK